MIFQRKIHVVIDEGVLTQIIGKCHLHTVTPYPLLDSYFWHV